MTDDRYGWPHQQERARLARVIETMGAYCQQGVPGNGSSGTCLYPSRLIPQGSASSTWALGHDDTGARWIGPVHALCNQRDGASRGGRVIAARRRRSRERSSPNRW